VTALRVVHHEPLRAVTERVETRTKPPAPRKARATFALTVKITTSVPGKNAGYNTPSNSPFNFLAERSSTSSAPLASSASYTEQTADA
jgi:hypothetical protein